MAIIFYIFGVFAIMWETKYKNFESFDLFEIWINTFNPQPKSNLRDQTSPDDKPKTVLDECVELQNKIFNLLKHADVLIKKHKDNSGFKIGEIAEYNDGTVVEILTDSDIRNLIEVKVRESKGGFLTIGKHIFIHKSNLKKIK